MLCVEDVYQMDKNNTQTLLPRECELDILHLDISTHGEAASVAAATRPPDMITRCIGYKKHCWITSLK